jgi:hypothetical protein
MQCSKCPPGRWSLYADIGTVRVELAPWQPGRVGQSRFTGSAGLVQRTPQPQAVLSVPVHAAASQQPVECPFER